MNYELDYQQNQTVGGEQFYVLEWDNNSDVALLMAKYNLNTDGTAQQDAAYSTTACAFSSTKYWSSSSPYILNDLIGFTSTDALGKAKSYGRSKGAVSSRLLSYEEANALKTKASSDTKISTMLLGKMASDGYLNYWMGTEYGYVRCIEKASFYSTSGQVGMINGMPYYQTVYGEKYDNTRYFGVRPVITVLKSEIS